MQRVLLTGLVMVLMTIPLQAQQLRPVPPSEVPTSMSPMEQAAAKQPKKVPVDEKLRYICKQLDLDEQQQQHVDGLFAVLEMEAEMTPEQAREHLELIMSTYQDMKDAQEAGDTERAEQIREQLRGLAPGVEAQRNFANGLMPVLNEQQQAKFQRLLKELKDATDLSLKPIQVVRLARSLKLTTEQKGQLRRIQQQFRQAVAAVSGPEQRKAALDSLIAGVAAILDSEQKAVFEHEIEKMRPDEPPAAAGSETAASAPATQPSAAP